MAWGKEARYVGYREADEQQPYAHFMKSQVDPPQPHVPEAIARGPVDPALIPAREALGDELHAEGYSTVETGYGRRTTGEVWVACLTQMPRVDPAMWEWWMAWHTLESARYKLWHPEAHLYAGVRFDRSGQLSLTIGELARGNTSYVDEVIGGHLDQLAISFVDPMDFGIDINRFDGVALCGRVGTVLAPVDVGMVCHQIRRVEGGAEMRSRFYLNVPHVRAFHPRAFVHAVRRGLARPRRLPFQAAFGAELLLHCGEEMHHLAQFLPELHEEFGAQR